MYIYLGMDGFIVGFQFHCLSTSLHYRIVLLRYSQRDVDMYLLQLVASLLLNDDRQKISKHLGAKNAYFSRLPMASLSRSRRIETPNLAILAIFYNSPIEPVAR